MYQFPTKDFYFDFSNLINIVIIIFDYLMKLNSKSLESLSYNFENPFQFCLKFNLKITKLFIKHFYKMKNFLVKLFKLNSEIV